jgi:bla regulator protein blaR1
MRHPVRLSLLAVLAVPLTTLSSGLHAAPQAAPTFDVASVKPNTTLGGERGAGFQPGGRFRARNMTVRGLIAAAYGDPQPLPSFRVVGGPGWIDSDRFDIDARAETNLSDMPNQPGWSPRGQLMLRALLADRFKMRARQETRESPAYALVTAKAGALGSQLRVSDGSDCAARVAGAPPPAADVITCGGFRFTPPERVSGRGLAMDDVARYLMLNTGLDRPVTNRTGLEGRYSFELDFTRGLPPPAADAPPDAAAAPSGTSIFTAVREQLGLRLDATRAPLDVVVIESIERPSPD